MPKITKKNCQKWQWNTKNILQFDPFSCWQPGIQPTYLVSTQKWPKNSQKMAKTAQKLKKLLKKGDFAQQNLPLRNDFFRLFSHPSSWPVWEARFGPPNFNRGLRFHGDMTETKSPIFTIFIKNINFFTDQDMIEAISQNCAKMKAPTKKVDKINFEAHVTRIIFHLLTLI